MFVGHYGVSFAAKAVEPGLPLSTLMISTQLLDVAWSALVLAGVEKVRLKRHFTATNDLDLYYMPFSHGLLTALAWSVLAGLASFYLLPSRSIASAVVMGCVCFSHWLLDLVVHVPDLPLIGNRFKAGFGLWNYRILAFAVELGVLFAGAGAYAASAGPTGLGGWFIAAFALALAAVQAFSVFGPPPASVKSLGISALAAYIIIAAIAASGERWIGA